MLTLVLCAINVTNTVLLYTVHTVQLSLNLACMYVFYLCKTLKCGVCFLFACGFVVHTSVIKDSLSHWVCVT